MATYYVNVFTKSANGSVMAGCGSFNNYTIDGRLSIDNAITVARENAIKECAFKNRDYLGFAIKKSERLDFSNAIIVDCPAENVLFL